MHTFITALHRFAIAVVLVAGPPCASRALAEDDGWLEFEEKPQEQNQWLVPPEQFEQWVFQNTGSAANQHKEFEAKLTLTIEQIDAACQLTDEQKEKLRLAGEVEIRRFFTRFDELRDHYIETKPNQNEFNEIWQHIQPLQQLAQAGLFGGESMFRRVADRALNDRQREVQRQAERERRNYRYRALVEMYVMMLEEHLPLSAEQRDELIELALETTRPPNVFGQTDQYYIMHQMSQTPKDRLEKIAPGPIGQALVTTCQMGRGYEHHLRSQGVHPVEEDEE